MRPTPSVALAREEVATTRRSVPSMQLAALGCGERKVAGGAGKEAVCLGPRRAIAVQLADRGLDRERQLGVGLNLPCHTLHQRQRMLLGVSGNGLVPGGHG